MASSMSNFKLKKSFVWKYGIGKLQKKKGSCDADDSGSTSTGSSTSFSSTLEPDLALNPQWNALLGDAGGGPAEDPTLPEKRSGRPSSGCPSSGRPLSVPSELFCAAGGRTLDPAVSQYIRVVAQMQGYDVVMRDAILPSPSGATDLELPIYETLSRADRRGDSSAADEDQWTLYENDTTDDELDQPLYQNGAPLQPIYANQSTAGEQRDEEQEVAPIYENLAADEEVQSHPDLEGFEAEECVKGIDGQMKDLRVKIPSDHGYDSYQYPSSSGSDGPSPKLSPSSERSAGSRRTEAYVTGNLPEVVAVDQTADSRSASSPRPLSGLLTAELLAETKRTLRSPDPAPSSANQSASARSRKPVVSGFIRKRDRELGLASTNVDVTGDVGRRTTATSAVRGSGRKLKPQSQQRVYRSISTPSHSANEDAISFAEARQAIAQVLETNPPDIKTKKTKVPAISNLRSNNVQMTSKSVLPRSTSFERGIPPPPPLPNVLHKLKPAQNKNVCAKIEADSKSMVDKSSKKKRYAPKPPDRSFSLPSFGNPRINLAKVFEDYKRKETHGNEKSRSKAKSKPLGKSNRNETEPIGKSLLQVVRSQRQNQLSDNGGTRQNSSRSMSTFGDETRGGPRISETTARKSTTPQKLNHPKKALNSNVTQTVNGEASTKPRRTTRPLKTKPVLTKKEAGAPMESTTKSAVGQKVTDNGVHVSGTQAILISQDGSWAVGERRLVSTTGCEGQQITVAISAGDATTPCNHPHAVVGSGAKPTAVHMGGSDAGNCALHKRITANVCTTQIRDSANVVAARGSSAVPTVSGVEFSDNMNNEELENQPQSSGEAEDVLYEEIQPKTDIYTGVVSDDFDCVSDSVSGPTELHEADSLENMSENTEECDFPTDEAALSVSLNVSSVDPCGSENETSQTYQSFNDITVSSEEGSVSQDMISVNIEDTSANIKPVSCVENIKGSSIDGDYQPLSHPTSPSDPDVPGDHVDNNRPESESLRSEMKVAAATVSTECSVLLEGEDDNGSDSSLYAVPTGRPVLSSAAAARVEGVDLEEQEQLPTVHLNLADQKAMFQREDHQLKERVKEEIGNSGLEETEPETSDEEICSGVSVESRVKQFMNTSSDAEFEHHTPVKTKSRVNQTAAFIRMEMNEVPIEESFLEQSFETVEEHVSHTKEENSVSDSGSVETDSIDGKKRPRGALKPRAAMNISAEEPIVPPPGFGDDQSVEGDAAVEEDPCSGAVEFEEFDMDWQPRRVVPPPVRSYMFGDLELHRTPGRKDSARHTTSVSTTSEVELQADIDSLQAPAPKQLEQKRLQAPAHIPPPAAATISWDVSQAEPPHRQQVEEPATNDTETRIAEEIRELKRREDELRRMRHKTSASSFHHEEQLSGYGSEEKESLSEETDSSGGGGVTSPAGPTPSLMGQRTRSQESLSSGHSSAGASTDLVYDVPPGTRRHGTGVTVRPLLDEDGKERWSFPRSSETPVEREIRLTRERESERRREQSLLASRTAANGSDKPTASQSHSRVSSGQLPISTTSRPRMTSPMPVSPACSATPPIPPPSGLTPTRVVSPTAPSSADSPVSANGATTSRGVSPMSTNGAATSRGVSPMSINGAATSRIKSPMSALSGQTRSFRPPQLSGTSTRGMMEKFISSRGRMRPPSMVHSRHQDWDAGVNVRYRTTYSKPQTRLSLVRAVSPTFEDDPQRPEKERIGKDLTAEEKIQDELKCMQRREEELRRHQSRLLAASQPDLLAAFGGLCVQQEDDEDDEALHPGSLCRTMSNPNLLDAPVERQGYSGSRRRRSALIDQWECRIQGADT